MEFLNEWFWFFLLLPLAALTGWVVDRPAGPCTCWRVARA